MNGTAKRSHHKRKPGTDSSTGPGTLPAAIGSSTAPVGSTIANGVRPRRIPLKDSRGRFIRRTAAASTTGSGATPGSTPTGNASSAGTDSGATPGGQSTGTPTTAAESEKQEPFTITQTEEIAESDRPKRKYTRRKSARTNAISDDSILAASVLIGVLDSAAQGMVGADAAITLNERNLIEEPLGRILDRLSPELVSKIQIVSDPILLAMGLGLWGMRVYKLNQMQTESATAQPVPTAPAEPVPESKPEDAPETISHDNGNNNRPLKDPSLMMETGAL